MTDKIAVLGGGSWGATLADHLSRLGRDVVLWEVFPEAADRLQKTRRLSTMPHLSLDARIRVTSDLAGAIRDRPVIVSVVPAEHVRKTFRLLKEKAIPAGGAWVVSASKGIENDTLKRMSEVIAEEVPAFAGRTAVLAGPSHAEEVAQKVPTAVVASGPADFPGRVAALFNAEHFRVYTSADMTGVEYGGSLKNIYAIACGVCDGLGLGDNTKAALMTRGLSEMARVGAAAGAQVVTFFGLSGLGDLIVTCMSRHSRNRLLGEKIGGGKTLTEALAEMTMVAEGVYTTKSGRQLADRFGLDLPIVAELHQCLFEGKPARAALRDLTNRPAAAEMVHVEPLLKSILQEKG